MYYKHDPFLGNAIDLIKVAIEVRLHKVDLALTGPQIIARLMENLSLLMMLNKYETSYLISFRKIKQRTIKQILIL